MPSAANAPATESLWRAVFERAVDPESFLVNAETVELLRSQILSTNCLESDLGIGDLGSLVRKASGWASAQSHHYLGLARASGQAGARNAALACAPLALVLGAWLQGFTSAASADDPQTLTVLRLYAADIGVGSPRASRGGAYLALLRELQIADSAVPVSRLTADPRIEDWAFRIPAVLLAMSRQPESFAPEILGADLCLRAAGLLPPLVLVRELLPDKAGWDVLDPGRARRDGSGGLTVCKRAVEMMIASSTVGTRTRVRRGFAWAFSCLREWDDLVSAELAAISSPRYAMGKLLKRRAREAVAYHRKYMVAGRPLAAWFAGSRIDHEKFLDALASSELISPGNADASPLVNDIISPSGPMFRIFSSDEVNIIRRWIDSLSMAKLKGELEKSPSAIRLPDADWSDSQEHKFQASDAAALRDHILRASSHDSTQAACELAPREAFYRLLFRNDTWQLRKFAYEYVLNWINRPRAPAGGNASDLPMTWPVDGLGSWLLARHEAQAKEFSEFQAVAREPVSAQRRKALIDMHMQRAPLRLLDGCWLQGFCDFEHACSEVGYLLFRTYWDELGNGSVELNHPLIYRELLDEMGVDLPATGSAEFAQWTGFSENSFEVPLYWLCIARFPRTFLPETLGLNLAIELSGVGDNYRRAHITLKEYGFTTRFVDIHNTIDNVGSGHSAWAADAIHNYMAELLVTQGVSIQSEAWQRIRSGFRSSLRPDAQVS